jgi:solute carrier family 25 2-oxodicarboxylate transporter 21
MVRIELIVLADPQHPLYVHPGGIIHFKQPNTVDVVKSRVQNASRVVGQKPKYNWTLPSLALIAREEGAAALYKGFLPKVLRLAPGGGVLLLVVEVVGGLSMLDFPPLEC